MRREEVERILRRGEKMASMRKGVVFRGGRRGTAKKTVSLKRRRDDAQQGKV